MGKSLEIPESQLLFIKINRMLVLSTLLGGSEESVL